MKQAIIFHGMPSKEEYMDDKYPSASNSHWLPWLQKQLLIKGWHVHTPEIKDVYEPTYEAYLKELSRYELDEETSLVGHSCGGGFLVRFLTENPNIKLAKVILVAPWLNTDGWSDTKMFDFDVDSGITDRCGELIIINSTDDMDTVQETVALLRDKVKDVHYIEHEGKGHYTLGSLGSEAFPEVYQELVRKI